MSQHFPWELAQKRSLPLDIKISMTKMRIQQWYLFHGGDVYVSFSGGKDSTVLLHIARQLYPDIPTVYCDTGLEAVIEHGSLSVRFVCDRGVSHEIVGKKRLRKFYDAFSAEHDRLIQYYQMPDDYTWLCKEMLKRIGVDVEAWNRERREPDEAEKH